MKGGGSSGGSKRKSIITSDLSSPENNDELLNDTYEQDKDNNEEEEEEEEERPKLAEGFFEIESVRRKRSRKGKLQYLVKWRGWPETANTWEPIENLMSCSDIIDAFEDSMKSAKKGSSKKHKRKSEVVLQPPPVKKKKKQQQQQQRQDSPAATYDVPSVKIKVIEEPLSRPHGNNPTCSKWAESNIKGTGNLKRLKRLSDSGSKVVSRQIGEMNEANELNLKLTELKGTTLTDKGKTDELDVNIQDRSGGVSPSNGNSNVNGQNSVWRSGEGVNPSNVNGKFSLWRSGDGVSPSNGISNVNGQNSVWACRSGGAKRRKSGSVKRFKQDSKPVVTNNSPDAIERIASANGIVLEHGTQNFDQVGNCFGSTNTVDTSRSMYAITKIIKPIEYSISTLNELQDILVTFLVLRLDGKEVMVDNRYLKANYPLLVNVFTSDRRHPHPSSRNTPQLTKWGEGRAGWVTVKTGNFCLQVEWVRLG